MSYGRRSHDRCVELEIMTDVLEREELEIVTGVLEEGGVMSGVLEDGGVMTGVLLMREFCQVCWGRKD